MNSLVGQSAQSQQEIEAFRQREVARRQGRKFIRVTYIGNTVARIDPDGTVCNLRMHAVEDIEIFPVPDYEHPGKEKLDQRITSTVVKLKSDGAGDIYGDMLDTEFNRHFLAKHKDDFVAADQKTAAEIELLVGRKYKVEPNEEESLKRRISEDQKRLDALKAENLRNKKQKKNKELEAELNRDVDVIGDEIPAEVIDQD